MSRFSVALVAGLALFASAPGAVAQAGLVEQQAYLKASNTANDQHFGWAVAASGDTVVVGAPWESGNAGAAYVFVRSGGGGWAQQALLKAKT